MEEHHKPLQLLPTPQSTPSSSRPIPLWRPTAATDPFEGTPSLDLQLSISVRPIRPNTDCVMAGRSLAADYTELKPELGCVEAMRWQAAEQIRLAATEKAYAERVREMTRREMELAQSEFARARHVWERARQEVEKAERMKERATNRVDATCMEITCQSCRNSGLRM
ncbi:Zinc finger protein SHOOT GRAVITROPISM 5 [Camellia lanceoleosa]|uniref:Zinc finger protein SHOOT GRAVITROPISM 5 n=1 Tax=Camellia lanceoleosa TaxID=1840588 RepID=A0ACC0I5S9_9ERIC|nr:Zinc finger protein SHOOT GRAVITROPISM 5 [Camellia lanceoleosa]